MLTNIHIENYALIDCLDIDINEGLNIITGETGAGKSVILGAVNTALGAKVNSDVIRAGKEYSFISVSFHIDDIAKLQAVTEPDSIDLSDGDIIIWRKILPNRSVFKINGVTVSASQVRSLSSMIIDIHSQRDNLLLLKSENQLKLVDSFGDEELNNLLERQKKLFEEYTECNSKIESIGDDAGLREREISLLEYEIKEIDEASLSAEEDTELEEKFSKLSYLEKIRRGVAESLQFLESGDYNSIDLLGKAIKSLGDAVNHDRELVQIYDSLRDAENILSDVGGELYSYIGNNEIDEEEFSRISDRIDLYNSLKRKYNGNVKDILAVLEDKKERLDTLLNSDEYITKLKKRIDGLISEMNHVCQLIHDRRIEIAENVQTSIMSEMRDLNFNNVKFLIEVKKNNSFSYNGFDDVEFLISLNSGEDVKPLKNIASGGEISRIMLAIKSVIAERDITETMVFDEIDTGISSRTAQCVAEKMHNISKSHQIICITHLPQIAAMADTHFYVYKEVSDKKTITDMKKLDEEARINELARFLGGSKITENVKENAKEMKQLADDYKNRQ
ncbi:MAG: DNA repair protein RecN [Lachnospiraceae bacterium]|nr:DNA repair protein RecN [Lachnospiraceae bacterium]MDY2956238.1 DNA repair protein RecN [Lachnospiraceae bacterium]